MNEPDKFIAFDWCGFGERYGRFTVMPSGKTLVCQAWMGQTDWDKAQLEWFRTLERHLIVHRCLNGAYRETNDTIGTVGDIVDRLAKRVEQDVAHV